MSSSAVASCVAVGGVERRAAAVAAVEAVDDVVGDAVALLLAEDELAREVGALGVVDEQVAQQQRRALHVAAASSNSVEQPRVAWRPVQQGHRRP